MDIEAAFGIVEITDALAGLGIPLDDLLAAMNANGYTSTARLIQNAEDFVNQTGPFAPNNQIESR